MFDSRVRFSLTQQQISELIRTLRTCQEQLGITASAVEYVGTDSKIKQYYSTKYNTLCEIIVEVQSQYEKWRDEGQAVTYSDLEELAELVRREGDNISAVMNTLTVMEIKGLLNMPAIFEYLMEWRMKK